MGPTRRVAFVVAVSLTSAASLAQAQLRINHHGRLLDNADAVVNSTTKFVFSIHTSSGLDPNAPDEEKWTGTFPNVPVKQGLYGVVLGDAPSSPIPYAAFDGGDRYLGVKVSDGDELKPRLRIGAVAFAALAQNAVTFGGKTLAEIEAMFDGKYAPKAGASYLELQSSASATPQTGHAAVTGTMRASSFIGAFDGDGSGLDNVAAKSAETATLATTANGLSNACAGCVTLSHLAQTGGKVVGLNADLIDGMEASAIVDLAQKNATGTGTGAPDASTCTNDTAGKMYFSTGSQKILYVCAGGAWVTAGAARPAQVANVQASAQPGAKVNLTWNAATDAQTYKVLASTDGTNFALLGTGLNGTAYSASGLNETQAYTFKVVGTNAAGDGPESATASATTTASSFGTGRDGAITVGATFDMNVASLASGRSFPDGIAYKVASNPNSTTIALASAANGIAAGDKILLMNMQGTAADHADTGNYEVLRVTAVSGSNVTVAAAPTRTYAGSLFSTQKVIVQRIPQYSNVTVGGAGLITASAWDGLADHGGTVYTGIVAFLANGTLSLSGNGIDVTAKGFRGGVPLGRGAEDAWNDSIVAGGTDGQNAPYTGGSSYATTAGADGGRATGTSGIGGKGGSEGYPPYGNPERGGIGYRGGGGGTGHFSTTQPSFGGGGGGTFDSGLNYAAADKLTLGGGSATGGGGGGGGQCCASNGGVSARGGKRDGTPGAGEIAGNGKRGGTGGAGKNGGGIVLVWAQAFNGNGPIRAVGGVGGGGGGGGGGGSSHGGGGGGGGGANGAAGGSVLVRFGTSSFTGTALASGGAGGGGGGGGSSGGGECCGAGGGGGAGPGGGGGGGGAWSNTAGTQGGPGGDAGLNGFDGSLGGTGGQASGGGGGIDTNQGGQANKGGCCSRGAGIKDSFPSAGKNGGAGGWGQHQAGGGGGAQGEDGAAGVASIVAAPF